MSVIPPGNISANAIFAKDDFLPETAPVIAAVSGGGDSLALLFLLHDWLSARGQAHRLRAVTVDHALRPEAADEAAYVARLCTQCGIAHRTMRWEGAKPKTGIQAAARAARYRLLAQAAAKFAEEIGETESCICTAHTMGDLAETYLMRKARAHFSAGDSPLDAIAARGLAGIARLSLLYQRFRLLRPLLGAQRADLRAYLKQRGIKWIDDPSNDNPHYERVRIRQSMTAELMAQCAAAAAEAARARQALSAAAAAWGRGLSLHLSRQGDETALALDLTPLQNQFASSVSKADSAALYLLLSYMAAVCGGKAYISARDARLEQFLSGLCQSGKGAKPQRISVSGAVLEKRRNILTVCCEQRNFPVKNTERSDVDDALSGADAKKPFDCRDQSDFSVGGIRSIPSCAESGSVSSLLPAGYEYEQNNFSIKIAKRASGNEEQRKNPFAASVPNWDAPLYTLFSPFLSAFG